MAVEVTIKRHPKFDPLYNPPPDTDLIICIGGRGGMKTYEVSKFIAVTAALHHKRCVVLRDEKELVRESILNEILMRFDTANASNAFTRSIERMETGLKLKSTGEMVVFTKGFRASSNSSRANLKSVSNIDLAVIEEAEDIRDEEKFNTFRDSIRKRGSFTIVILNTPDVNHWIVKRYFNIDPVPNHDGYFSLSPKTIKGFIAIQTSFRDNNFLPDTVKERYESYGDPDSPIYNLHHYLTAICGYASTGRTGQVIKHAKPITLAEYHALPYREVFGQDFGTASPAGLVGAKFHRNKLYVRELNYKPATALQLGKIYSQLGFGPADRIVADSAEPKTIDKLRKGWRPTELSPEDFMFYPRLAQGFFIVEADKGRGSVMAGIDDLCSTELYITEDSTNIWNEVANYIYATDKNGTLTSEPVDEHNHCFTGDTRITQPKGYRPRIDEILVGCLVRSNHNSVKVKKVYCNGELPVATYTIVAEAMITPFEAEMQRQHPTYVRPPAEVRTFEVSCTPTHKVITHDMGSLPIMRLLPGNLIWGDSNSSKGPKKLYRVLSVTVSNPRVETVYDLEVEKPHWYFANGLLVHNCIDPIRYVLRDFKHPRAGAPSAV